MNDKRTDQIFVWLDLEMTGLNLDKDVIIEIACLVTDDNLTLIAEGPSIVINQPEDKLQRMDSWCTEHHTKSGLMSEVRASRVTVQEAEEATIAFMREHVKPGNALLSGNSVWQDRAFLRVYMPQLYLFFHYRMIDVTTVKELINRWYPNNAQVKFQKKDLHRALPDCYESVEELKHYRKYFFV
jgi:oligoribonuclease